MSTISMPPIRPIIYSYYPALPTSPAPLNPSGKQMAGIQDRLDQIQQGVDQLNADQDAFEKQDALKQDVRRQTLPKRVAIVLGSWGAIANLGGLFIVPPIIYKSNDKKILSSLRRKNMIILPLMTAVYALTGYFATKYLLKKPSQPDTMTLPMGDFPKKPTSSAATGNPSA